MVLIGDRGGAFWAKRDHCTNHRRRSHDGSQREEDLGASSRFCGRDQLTLAGGFARIRDAAGELNIR
jgi:hypothetical protein